MNERVPKASNSHKHWNIKRRQDNPMRNVIFAINITLDGCCDHTKTIADEELLEHYTHLLRDVDLLVFGRKTYQLMVPYWPDVAKNQSETKASIEFAQTFVSINKVVFSQIIRQRRSKNTKIVRTNPRDEILKLKQAARQEYFNRRCRIFLHN